MKQYIVKVAEDLKKNIISDDRARTLLLSLFGVNGTSIPLTPKRVDKLMIDNSKKTWLAARGTLNGWKKWWDEHNKLDINMEHIEIVHYHSSDYAGLECGELKFYYGYEVEDPITEDWCFQVKKNDEEIYRTTRTKLQESMGNCILQAPIEFLVTGIGMWLITNNKC